MKFEKDIEFEGRKSTKKFITIIVIVVLAIILLCSSITIVGAGHTGVVSTFGAVSENVLEEGMHFKAPWQRVTKVDNRITKLEVETGSSTKDLQTLKAKLAVSYRINNNMSYSVFKNVGKDYENVLVTPAVNEVLKAVTAKYTAEECITTRSKVSQELVAGINQKLNAQGIYVNDVNIIDFDFSDTYNKAIEEKQVAEQQLKKAETDKKTAVVSAQAEAEKKKIAAQAEADATLTKAEAQAKANKKLNDSLSDKVIQYNYAQKWNGELPKVSGSGATIVDSSSILGEKTNK
mgnify:CR=1 FL=1